MPHYSVIQYLPDFVREERINVGIVVWDKEDVIVRLLSNWDRVRLFSGDPNVGPEYFPDLLGPLDHRTLFQLFTLGTCIRLTRPRGSIGTLSNLLESDFKRFVEQ